jgi:hypothetical protein
VHALAYAACSACVCSMVCVCSMACVCSMVCVCVSREMRRACRAREEVARRGVRMLGWTLRLGGVQTCTLRLAYKVCKLICAAARRCASLAALTMRRCAGVYASAYKGCS